MPYQFLNRRQFDLIWYFYPLHGRTLLVGRTSTATSWRSSSLSPQLSLQILSLSNEDFVRGPVKCMQEPWCLLLLTEMTICSAEKNCRQNDSKWSLSLPSSLLELIWNDLERIISITWSGGITNVCNGIPYMKAVKCNNPVGPNIMRCHANIAWQMCRNNRLSRCPAVNIWLIVSCQSVSQSEHPPISLSSPEKHYSNNLNYPHWTQLMTQTSSMNSYQRCPFCFGH